MRHMRASDLIFKRRKISLFGLAIFIIVSLATLSYKILSMMILDIIKLIKWIINYWHFRHIDYSYWQIKRLINEMSPRQFEIFIGELFKANDFEVELTPPSNDYGRDLIINGSIFVEIKHYSETNFVGREIVQKLLGSCAMFGVKDAVIVTTGKFYENAYECVEILEDKEFNLTLLDMEDIMKMIKKTDIDKIPRMMRRTFQYIPSNELQLT